MESKKIITKESWKAVIEYCAIYEITKVVDDSVYETKFLGFTRYDDSRFTDSKKYIKASLPTSITKQENVNLELI